MRSFLFLLAFIPTIASAQFYVTGSTGLVNYSPASVSANKNNDFTFGTSIGYQVNSYFGVQAGVNYGGSYTIRGYTSKVNSEYVAGVFSVPIYKRYYGIAGVGMSVSQVSNKKGANSIVQPGLGLGLGYRLTETIDFNILASDVGLRFLGNSPKMDTKSITFGVKYLFL